MIRLKAWTVYYSDSSKTSVGVINNFCKHDVLLRVDGNFEDNEQRDKYCQDLADKLNSAQLGQRKGE